MISIFFGLQALSHVAVNIKEGTPIQDLCALQKWAALRLCQVMWPENMNEPFFCFVFRYKILIFFSPHHYVIKTIF
jgi:hypothetical protein